MAGQLRWFYVTVTARIPMDETCLRTEDVDRNRAIHHGFSASTVVQLFNTRCLAGGTLFGRWLQNITEVKIEADDGTVDYIPWDELPYQ